ncbi:MAG: hypothetical protein HN337_10030 [Deltaproteobacteria bacterium]|nr:hypothetical protein [Deltaproteobacteria bacterium]
MSSQIIHGSKLTEILREKVQKALEKQRIETMDLVEFYIVNLLEEFHSAEGTMASGEEAIEKPLSILLMEAMSGSQAKQQRCLRQVGDKALVVAGFFGDNINRGLMDASYYISIGGSAYSTLANIHGSSGTFSDLYNELSKKFAGFVDVVSSVAPWNNANTDADLVRIYERWIATGDDTLKELLERKGIDISSKSRKE